MTGAILALLQLMLVPVLLPPVFAQLTSKDDTLDGAARRFAEETFPALADSAEVPGAVLAVVSRAGILVSKGYGYADLATERPANPEWTLFRAASVSKPVTATAVLKLWERGAFDLHTDINRYLDRMAVPEAFDTPVTPHGLLTHTAGFDEQLFGSGAPDQAPALAEYLKAKLPTRVYPPDLLHSYSNHGYGLLGLLVEETSGRAFEAFVKQSIFEPLQMTRSTFRQPPEHTLRASLATGYACSGKACTPLPYDYIALGPAGALQTTAADMARFIDFHLNGASHVLADSTRRQMHGPQWQPHPALGGMGYGFYRGMVGRYEALRHAGGWAGWSSQLVMVPEVGLGYFVAVNTDAHPFLEALLKRFAADVLDGPIPPPGVEPGRPLTQYAGTYRLARHAHRGLDKVAVLAGLPMPDLQVEVTGDSALVLLIGETRERLHPTGAAGVFIKPGLDPRRYYFETDESGVVIRIHTDYASLERIPWWATRQLSVWTFAVCFVAFASAVGAWLLNLLRKRAVPAVLRRARGLAALTAACHLLFAVGFTGALIVMSPQDILHPLPLWFRALFVLPLAGAVLGGVTVPFSLRLWRHHVGSVGARIHHTVVVLAAVAVIPLLAYWNVLSFQF